MRLDDLVLHETEFPAAPARPRLGEILLAGGEISQGQLTAALARGEKTGRRLGEELAAAGLLSADRLRRALRLQRRLMIAALFSAALGQTQAADVRALVPVSAAIVDTVDVRTLYQAQTLVITAHDVARGYVDVPAASRFHIRSKGASRFEFTSVSNVFESVRVDGVGAGAKFSRAGGTLIQTARADAATNVSLDYRFELSTDASAGAHRWPVSLTVVPL